MTNDDRALEELLAAYTLHSCDPDEAVAVEALLRRRPDLADEVERLATAAAWLGALEATEPPSTLRDAVLATTAGDPLAAAARVHDAEARRLTDELARLEPERYGVLTPNGLTARSLVVHLAAQESLLARALGRAIDDLDVTDVDERTALLIERYRDRPYGDVLELWHDAVAAVRSLADERPGTTPVDWLGLRMPPADALTARSFENWVHRDDLRRVRGAGSDPPPAPELAVMATLAMRTLPAGLAAQGRARPGRSARIVLTGTGGGTWLLPFDPTEAASGDPDVTLTASALDWCLLVGERLDAADLEYTVGGDTELAVELVAAAPAFATL